MSPEPNAPARRALAGYVWAASVVAVAAAFVALNLAAPRSGYIFVREVGGKLWHFGLFVLFWFAVYAVGRGAERLVFGRRTGWPDVAWALGIVAMSLAAFVLCGVRLVYAWPARAMILIAAAGGAFFLRREAVAAPARAKRWLGELDVGPAVLVAATAAYALPVALMAAEPPVLWDALTYQLTVPKVYAAAHGFAYLPYNVFSSMPLGATLFFLWPYLWDGLIAANASHMVATVLASVVTYRLARLWLEQFYAALAAAFLVLTPVVYAVMGGAHTDQFQILWGAAALLAYFRRGDAGWTPARRALAVGVFLGAALTVKYQAYAAALAFVPVWGYDLIRKRARLREVALTAAVAVAFLAPWFVKAYIERGNPVFPALYGVFGGRDFSPLQAERIAAWSAGTIKARGVGEILTLPYRISVTADAGFDRLNGIYLPFLLPLAALGVWAFRRAGRLVAYGWSYILAWAFGPLLLRYLGGALPAVAAAAAGSLAYAEQAWGGGARRIWRAFLVVGVLAVSLPYVTGSLFRALPGHGYLIGEVDARTFVRNYCGYYRAQEYINEKLPPDAKVLLVFTNQTLYLERPAIYDSFFEASAFLLAAEKAPDGAALYRLARRWGVTHVHYYHYYEKDVWPAYRPRAREVFVAFLQKYAVPVYEDRFGVLYELVTSAP